MPFLRQVSNFVFLICLMFLAGCSAYVKNNDSALEPEPSDTSDPITWEDCGGLLDDHPCDFTFTDQNGEEWNLYENYGKVILLDFSTMWCGYCRVAAEDVQLMQDTYGDDGFIWVTLLVEDTQGGDVSLDESIKYYEIGILLKNHCEEKLKNAETKIKKVVDNKIKNIDE